MPLALVPIYVCSSNFELNALSLFRFTELLAGSMWNLLHDNNVRLDWKLQHKLLSDTAKGMVL